jgi:hypothetical protein
MVKDVNEQQNLTQFIMDTKRLFNNKLTYTLFYFRQLY